VPNKRPPSPRLISCRSSLPKFSSMKTQPWCGRILSDAGADRRPRYHPSLSATNS
jgi:hypothetical protein